MQGNGERETILEKFEWIIKVRAVAGIVVLVLFGAVRLTRVIEFPFLLFSVAPVLVLFINQLYPFILKRTKDLSPVFLASQFIDIMLITWGIYFIGGMNMFTAVLTYPLVFIFTGIVLGGKRTYVMANLSFLVYASMVYLESRGVLPSTGAIDIKMSGDARVVLTLLVCPFFNLIAFYTVYLSDMILKQDKELREIQKKIKKNEKLTILGKFAGIIAHELRTPLGVIKNATYYLRIKLKDAESEENIKDILSIVDREVNASARIIDDTLSFVKLKELSMTMENINNIVKNVVDEISFDERVTVKLELGGDIPEAPVDRPQIRRVFYNVILNAYQAIPGEGEVYIKSSLENGFIAVSVSDTGSGIREENIGNVFEPLFSTKTVGTGFGLAIGQSIMKMHKGTIGVTSQIGKGSTFVIKIPVERQFPQQ